MFIRRWYLRGLLVGALIVSVVVASGVFVLRSLLIGNPPSLRISRETTYLIDVQPDGTLPYLRTFIGAPAIAVRPDENAATLLSKLQVVNSFSRELRPGAELQFFSVSELLDILFSEGSPTRFDLNSSSESEIEAQLKTATTKPWHSEEFPLIEEWLIRNASVIEFGMRVGQCSHHFVSCPQGDEPILSWVDPEIEKYRILALLLTCRAQKRIAAGQWSEAFSDSEACHQFSRLASQSPGVICHLLSIVVESQALRIDQALAKSAEGNADRLLKLKRSLSSLLPLPPIAEVLDHKERLVYLQMIYRFAVFPESAENQHLIGEARYVREACLPGTDWNVVMKTWNREINTLVKVVEEPNFVEQHAQLTALSQKLKSRILAENDTPVRSLISVAPLSEHSADRLSWLFLPSAAQSACARFALSSRQLKTDVLVSIYRFQAAHGRWPDTLGELVPEYLTSIPINPSTQAPPEYSTIGGQFSLYVPWLRWDGKLEEEE